MDEAEDVVDALAVVIEAEVAEEVEVEVEVLLMLIIRPKSSKTPMTVMHQTLYHQNRRRSTPMAMVVQTMLAKKRQCAGYVQSRSNITRSRIAIIEPAMCVHSDYARSTRRRIVPFVRSVFDVHCLNAFTDSSSSL